MKSFKDYYYSTLCEAKKKKSKDGSLDSKIINLYSSSVSLKLFNKESLGYASIAIIYDRDPSMRGEVKYTDIDSAQQAYSFLNLPQDVLNFINFHSKNDFDSYGLYDILRKESLEIKKRFEPSQIADLGLDFNI